MKKFVSHPAIYVTLYVLFMLPTYILPYLGSNSTVLNTAGAASGAGINPAFWIHLLALLILAALAWFRGERIRRKWLVVFPALALCFDLLPLLSIIPLVPTALHVAAIIVGVAVQESPPSKQPA